MDAHMGKRESNGPCCDLTTVLSSSLNHNLSSGWLPALLGFLAKSAAALQREPQKGDIINSSIPSVIQIQREAFSGFSMRNRGILEKELGQSRSDREQRLQK